MDLINQIKAKKLELESQIAPVVYKHLDGHLDSGIVDGVIQFIVIAVLIVFVPGILYVVSTGSIVVPVNTTFYNASVATETSVANGVSTIGVIPTIFAIVLIISVLMLLAMRR